MTALLSGCAYYNDDPMAMKGEPYKPYMIGPPYQINGQWFHPKENFNYDRVGVASWYGRTFHGRRTANGETYDMNLMTAAHPTLPMPTMVSVTNLKNGRDVVVRINDRGPFHDGRIIDLSRRAADRLGLKRDGVGRVRVRVLRTASLRLKREAVAEMTQPVRETGRRRQVAEHRPETGNPAAISKTTPETTGPEKGPPRVRTAELDPAALDRINPDAGAVATGKPIDIRPGATRALPARIDRSDQQYFVQIGSFAERGNAVRVGQRLEGVALTQVAEQKVDRTTYYRVRVGPFASRRESRSMLERIRQAGYADARIVVE